jgi:hypothetical protein
MNVKIFFSFLVVSLIASGCATAISEYSVTVRDAQKFTSKDVGASDYRSATYVIETKGEGQVACINIGSTDGVGKGSKIDFYTIKIKNSKKFEIILARGKVMLVSAKTCWVEVNNYETAEVMENHFARLSADQSITMGEKFKNPSLFFKKKKPAEKKK